MKKIILYGVRHVELRRKIEYFLGSGYEISGYSDTYYRSDVLDGKRFIPPEELAAAAFDYILPLSYKEAILADMKAGLLTQGVPPEKILLPTMFLRQGKETMQVDLIGDIETQYQGEEGLLFGLSYSLRGIHEKGLRPVFYDCSWHGLDLYYNYRIFQYMRRRGLLKAVRTALLVFPYYYFSYDMSRSAYHYREGQMFALRGLDDWHNYRRTPGAEDYVENYRMFGEKVSAFYHFHRYEQQNRGRYPGGAGEADLNGAWYYDYPETTEENAALYAAFCRELAEENITPAVVVPPYYLEGLTPASLERAGKLREEFYRIAEPHGPVFDFFDRFADRRELFADLTHLNSDGAAEFTEQINQTVLQGRKEAKP
ncbi:hypothetical protein AALC17_12790 [Oscillospiraceae bacterium 38-13]